MTFASFVVLQIERQDSVGVLARDLMSECERIGREIAALRNRRDCIYHAMHAPRELQLTRADAIALWEEWLIHEAKPLAAQVDASEGK